MPDVEKTIVHLYNFVNRIVQLSPMDAVVVAGDFNAVVEFIKISRDFEKLGLKNALEVDVPTHMGGQQLDAILTNLKLE